MDFRGKPAVCASPAGPKPHTSAHVDLSGFPTDMQAPMMALALCSRGASVFCETIFENRFMHGPGVGTAGRQNPH